MTILPPEPIRRKIGDWVAVTAALCSTLLALGTMVGGAYAFGKWTTLYDTRLKNVEEYQEKNEEVTKERTAQRTTEIATLRADQYNLAKNNADTSLVISQLQQQQQYMAAQSTQFGNALKEVTTTLNQIVTQQALTQSKLDALKEELSAKGKM